MADAGSRLERNHAVHLRGVRCRARIRGTTFSRMAFAVLDELDRATQVSSGGAFRASGSGIGAALRRIAARSAAQASGTRAIFTPAVAHLSGPGFDPF